MNLHKFQKGFFRFLIQAQSWCQIKCLLVRSFWVQTTFVLFFPKWEMPTKARLFLACKYSFWLVQHTRVVTRICLSLSLLNTVMNPHCHKCTQYWLLIYNFLYLFHHCSIIVRFLSLHKLTAVP